MIRKLEWIKTTLEWKSKVAVGMFSITPENGIYILRYNGIIINSFMKPIHAMDNAQLVFEQMIDDCMSEEESLT